MEILKHRPLLFNNDYWGHLPPSFLISIGAQAASEKSVREGISSKDLMEKLGGVWMYSRLSLTQSVTLTAHDELSLHCTPHTRDGAGFLRIIDYYTDGKKAATLQLVTMAVSMEHRSIIRPSVIESSWEFKEKLDGDVSLKKLPRISGLEELNSPVTIRYSDCDENMHLNSAKYADLVCDLCGYYNEKPRLMEELQIDFSSESLPGDIINFQKSGNDSLGYITGTSEEANKKFTAKYKMSPITSS